jgi:iodotyrosine deiodinase
VSEPTFEPLAFREYPPDEMARRADALATDLARRRTVRAFSPRPVPRALIETCVRAAATAPSGANQQPWHFAVIGSPALKRRVREAAEAEEREFYTRRAPQEWLDALAPLGTDADKPFLETAPHLIAIFAQPHGLSPTGEATKHYYVSESVGIATGLLIAALHHAGLATLTHTPSPMRFLNELCERPAHERAYLLLVTGYPSAGATVPRITKKPFDEIASFL